MYRSSRPGICVGVGVGGAVGTGVEVGVGVGVAVGTGVEVGVGVGLKVWVGKEVGLDVAVGMGVWVAIGSGVEVDVKVAVGVGSANAAEANGSTGSRPEPQAMLARTTMAVGSERASALSMMEPFHGNGIG